MYECIYMYIHTHKYKYMYTYMYIYIYAYTYIYIYTYVCSYILSGWWQSDADNGAGASIRPRRRGTHPR